MMANFVLPIVARTRRGLPAWVDEQASLGYEPVIPNDASISSSKNGLIIVCGSTGSTVLPMVNSIGNDKAEVLVKFERYVAGSASYGNTGGAIAFNESKSINPTASYHFCISSGSSLTYNLYKYTASGYIGLGGSVGLGSSASWQNKDILLRARKELSALKLKAWYEGNPEPTSWGISVTDSTYKLDTIDFRVGSDDQVISIKKLAYATNGDTASFDLPPVVDIIAGNVPDSKAGDIVNIHELATHDIVDSIILPSSGSWQSKLYDSRPVYARIERAGGSEYDLLFAKYGDAYLGGDYPDGSIKDDGVPSAGEVSILYKSDDPILGGATIAKDSAAPSGEWRVSGLQPNVPFDVVARKPDRKDTVVSGVMGVPDPSFKFSLMGSASNVSNYLKGLFFAKGATPPVTAQFTGATPYGMDASAFAIDGNIVNVNTPMRDYGQFNFSIDISDGNGNTISSPVVITDAKRAPFVDFIAAVNSMDRGSGSAPMTTVIPNTVQEGDMLVLGIMRRGGITVSDNNSGAWTLGADSINTTMSDQGTSIYYRTAKADDAGKTITVSGPYSGRLIVYLSVYRGKFAPLMVNSARSGPVRYDSTYNSPSDRNLEPIPHSSGFLIRAVSNVYSLFDNSALMEISNMTPTGPAFGNPYRLQVAYAHLSEPATLISTYKTATSDADDVIPEVSIILDEVRP